MRQTERWPWPLLLSMAAAIVAMGVAIDLDMLWLAGVPIAAVLTASTRGARQPASRCAPGSTWPWAAVLILALAANVVVQFAGRQADLPIPNTLGATAAALIFIIAFRPVNAGVDTSPADSTR